MRNVVLDFRIFKFQRRASGCIFMNYLGLYPGRLPLKMNLITTNDTNAK